MTRRHFLSLPVVGRPPWAAAGPLAGSRAARYLWSRQSPDGGWHSATYGLLRSGQSLTPFVLEALLRLPDPPSERVGRALDFLHTGFQPENADYPNYATALAVLALRRLDREASPLVAWLRTQQLSPENGWSEDHPAYGAWGMGGLPQRPPEPGHVDLSMTRYVLQALAAAGVPPGDPTLRRARVFLDRCQNPDGGFQFTTVVLEANKAGLGRSYGTATADGILSLAALGDPAASARRWLAQRHRTDLVPGFTTVPQQRWARGLRFYYAAAVHEAMPELPVAPLLGRQRPDGSFANPEPIVKEDDPLIATGLALRALIVDFSDLVRDTSDEGVA
jgi:hypothetical protein